jgi:hypothetical protein
MQIIKPAWRPNGSLPIQAVRAWCVNLWEQKRIEKGGIVFFIKSAIDRFAEILA